MQAACVWTCPACRGPPISNHANGQTKRNSVRLEAGGNERACPGSMARVGPPCSFRMHECAVLETARMGGDPDGDRTRSAFIATVPA